MALDTDKCCATCAGQTANASKCCQTECTDKHRLYHFAERSEEEKMLDVVRSYEIETHCVMEKQRAVEQKKFSDTRLE